jgi:hypothetical protein
VEGHDDPAELGDVEDDLTDRRTGQLRLPRVGRRVGVALRGDDRAGGSGGHGLHPVGIAVELARGPELQDVAGLDGLHRDHPGDHDRSGVEGAGHAAGEDRGDAEVQDDDPARDDEHEQCGGAQQDVRQGAEAETAETLQAAGDVDACGAVTAGRRHAVHHPSL